MLPPANHRDAIKFKVIVTNYWQQECSSLYILQVSASLEFLSELYPNRPPEPCQLRPSEPGPPCTILLTLLLLIYYWLLLARGSVRLSSLPQRPLCASYLIGNRWLRLPITHQNTRYPTAALSQVISRHP
jgi:hypothetical protein